MGNIEILKELASIDEMLALRDQAIRANDEESHVVVRMMDHAVAGVRARIREAVSASQFTKLQRLHPVLTHS